MTSTANKLATSVLLLCAWCAPDMAAGQMTTVAGAAARIIVTIRDQESTLHIEPGATPRMTDHRSSYDGSAFAQRINRDLQREYQLNEETAWRIGALRVYCVVYRVDDRRDAAALIAQLALDTRIESAQQLNEFVTQARALQYDDPYFNQQTSIATMRVAEAQRWSAGRGIRIAVIDTGADTEHPDLASRVALSRNFVDGDGPATRAEQHGTAVAGAIAAVANNGLGIIGVAPDAELLLLRACWQPDSAATGRCNSVTLARALDFALDRRIQIVNLSLAGPRDPLLERLVQVAIARGIIVIGAAGGTNEFPGNIAGVIAVADSDQLRAPGTASALSGAVAAPGRDVLTLAPGGRYGHVSGASMSAALTSGVVALILAAREDRSARLPHGAQTVLDLLRRSSRATNSANSVSAGSIDACRAVADRMGRRGCDTALAAGLQ